MSWDQPQETARRAAERKALCRVVLVAGLHLSAFELVQQLSVHWRESSDELCVLALYVLTLFASAWAVFPALAATRAKSLKLILGSTAAVGLLAAVYAGDYMYSWHLRPNLGLYREPDWVREHPSFQRELQRRIQANLWWRAKGTTLQSGAK